MTWINLGKINNVLPSTTFLASYGGTKFLVLRESNGSFRVIPPSCPHMSASLQDGFFDGEILTCEKHLWQWKISSGEAIGIAELPLNIYESKVDGDNLLVNFIEILQYDYQK